MGYGHGSSWGMMGGYGGGGMMIIWVVVLIAIIAFVVWLVRSATSSGTHHLPLGERQSSGLDVLEERYARGEIKRDEYLEKKHDMLDRGTGG